MTVPGTDVALGPVRVKVAEVIVAGFMASLNVAETVVLAATPVVPLTGSVELTVAGGTVVKFHAKFVAKAMPLMSRAPVVTFAM